MMCEWRLSVDVVRPMCWALLGKSSLGREWVVRLLGGPSSHPPGQPLPSSREWGEGRESEAGAAGLPHAVDRRALICLSAGLPGGAARPALAWLFEAHKVDLYCEGFLLLFCFDFLT